MPELPEVETVKKVLKKQVIGKKINTVKVNWDNIIAFPKVKDFKTMVKSQTIKDVLRRGKWLMFKLDDYFLLSHLRMEGKYFFKQNSKDCISKHEHVIFNFTDGTQLRYHDTRKFGKMYLINKNDVYNVAPLNKLGLEPFDDKLTIAYLKENLKEKPIKSLLLDQSIIAGIGNIYADEILFKCKINPEKSGTTLTQNNLTDIIKYTRDILLEAIKMGGTTIKSYTSSLGVQGNFQINLQVHTKKVCDVCGGEIIKVNIGGRGTYYCPKCQK